MMIDLNDLKGRTPHGVRELKRRQESYDAYLKRVAPHTGCVN